MTQYDSIRDLSVACAAFIHEWIEQIPDGLPKPDEDSAFAQYKRQSKVENVLIEERVFPGFDTITVEELAEFERIFSSLIEPCGELRDLHQFLKDPQGTIRCINIFLERDGWKIDKRYVRYARTVMPEFLIVYRITAKWIRDTFENRPYPAWFRSRWMKFYPNQPIPEGILIEDAAKTSKEGKLVQPGKRKKLTVAKARQLVKAAGSNISEAARQYGCSRQYMSEIFNRRARK